MTDQPRSVGPDAHDELDELLCFDLYAASRAVTAAYRPLLTGLGLTYPQYLVLVVLWAGDHRPIKHLAETLRLDHATLTPLLRRMADAGLLVRERNPADERSMIVHLTERGSALRQHRDDLQCRMADLMGIGEAEVEALRGLLRELTAHLQTHEVDQPVRDRAEIGAPVRRG